MLQSTFNLDSSDKDYEAIASAENGDIIIGNIKGRSGGKEQQAFRWTIETGMEYLAPAVGINWSEAVALSLDGKVVAGNVSEQLAHTNLIGFVWSSFSGMTYLGGLSGGSCSKVTAISQDGSVVVGNAPDMALEGRSCAFRWTKKGGMESLGVLNNGGWSEAIAVSFDGSVVVGNAADGSAGGSSRAFRWTAEEGMVSLGILNHSISSEAITVSSDGNIVIGHVCRGEQQQVFHWSLGDVLKAIDVRAIDDWGHAMAFLESATEAAYEESASGAECVGSKVRWVHGKGVLQRGQLKNEALMYAVMVSFSGKAIVCDATPQGGMKHRQIKVF